MEITFMRIRIGLVLRTHDVAFVIRQAITRQQWKEKEKQ